MMSDVTDRRAQASHFPPVSLIPNQPAAIKRMFDVQI